MLKADESYVHWLKNLKPGDEVARPYGYNRIRIERVAKITLTGMIRLENDELYDNSGCSRGSTNYGSAGYFYLKPVTDEIRKEIARMDAIDYLNAMNYYKLPTQSLLDILKIIKESEQQW